MKQLLEMPKRNQILDTELGKILQSECEGSTSTSSAIRLKCGQSLTFVKQYSFLVMCLRIRCNLVFEEKKSPLRPVRL